MSDIHDDCGMPWSKHLWTLPDKRGHTHRICPDQTLPGSPLPPRPKSGPVEPDRDDDL